jgi:hypothetical protein
MQEELELKLDKTKISFSDSFDDSEEKEYWLSRTPQERIRHIQKLRQINYGHRATERLRRVLEVVECEWS